MLLNSFNGMKQIIDRYYTENYSLLCNAARKRIKEINIQLEPESVVSASYQYVYSRIGSITEDEVPKLAMGFICFELSMYNSQTRLKAKIHANDIEYEDSNYSDGSLLMIDIEAFEQSLDRLDRIVWKVYYHKGLTKKRELAAHFRIDETSAFNLIKNLKIKYLQYAKS